MEVLGFENHDGQGSKFLAHRRVVVLGYERSGGGKWKVDHYTQE